jgi:hypothetical protein
LIGWRLTPGDKLQPIKKSESDRDGGGRVLFVLACGLVASAANQFAPFAPDACNISRFNGQLTKVIIPRDVGALPAIAEYHQI